MITTQHCEEQRVPAWRAEAIHVTSFADCFGAMLLAIFPRFLGFPGFPSFPCFSGFAGYRLPAINYKLFSPFPPIHLINS